MHSLEPELNELRAAGRIDEASAAHAIAAERGAQFSIHGELRIASYAAVALVSIGVGLVVKENYAHIGPLAILGAILAAAGLCYATAVRARRSGAERGVVGDYLLLLGGLLLSAGLGFGEAQFHWLGDQWAYHLLLLAAIHGLTAYYFDSPLLLSLALAAFAGWFGVEPRLGSPLGQADLAPRFGWRALECAALLSAARWTVHRLRPRPDFRAVFDHFALNLAFSGALSWCAADDYRWPALALLAVLAAIAIRHGMRTGSELMLVYGTAWPAIGLCVLVVSQSGSGLLTAWCLLGILVGASIALWQLHSAMRRRA